MRRVWGGVAVAALLAAGGGRAQSGALSVASLNGATVPFASLTGKTTAVVFLSTRCPISNAYIDRINAIYREYSARGVKFVFINANFNEPAQEVAEHARKAGFAFPVYRDPGNAAADHFGAQVTPESFALDAAGAVQYRGAIDDAQNPARIRVHGLRQALDALLAGQAVALKETKAFGCTLKRSRRPS